MTGLETEYYRPRLMDCALLGLTGMLLALWGCAVDKGPRTTDAKPAAVNAVSGAVPAGVAVDAAPTPGITIDPKILGAKPSPRQQAKKVTSPINAASDSPPAPTAVNAGQPVVEVGVNSATKGPLASREALVVSHDRYAATRSITDPMGGANSSVSQVRGERIRRIGDKPRLAPALRRDRAVVPAQYQDDQASPAVRARDAESPEDAGVEETPAPPNSRRRSPRKSETPPEPGDSSGELSVDSSSEQLLDGRVRIPLEGSADPDKIELIPNGDRISLMVRGAPLSSVLSLLAKQQGLNVIVNDDSDSNISVTLNDVDFDEAWSAIVEIAGCTWTRSNNIILVSSIESKAPASYQVQDRQLRVFPLNFVDAKDVQLVVKGILSPVGKVFTMQTLPKERRSTQETVVVEDIPPYMQRVADYIATVDVPPRQVMIEVHILQITLEDDCLHGVNLQYLFGAGGNDVVLSTVGFANPAAATASLFTVSGAHFNSVVQALESTTDSKTLASPKVIVANGQQARIQIGQRFGYFVTTTTQTSTLQNVNFLNTGVVLAVTPQISADNQVLMSVTPEVSTGQITNGLPQTETTTTDTTVLLPDGVGMVIGGLIKEQDIETQDKVPILGDLRVVGRLFQKRNVVRQRVEIIIALLPRIAPYPPGYEVQHQIELERAFTPLTQGPLYRAPRPFEAKLPDAYENPRCLRWSRLPDAVKNLKDPYPLPPQYFFPTAREEFPPAVPPAPVPLHNLSLPPLPVAPALPPVDVIIPDVPEATTTAPTPAAAPSPGPAPNSMTVKTVKSRSLMGRRVKRDSVADKATAGPAATGQPGTGQTADPEPSPVAPKQPAQKQRAQWQLGPLPSAPVKSAKGPAAAEQPVSSQ